MAKRQRTYYVSKNNSWHTYEFLERRKMDPKWRWAYLSAREQRKKETIICVFLSIVLIVLLAIIFIVFNFYSRETNTGESTLIPVSSVESTLESASSSTKIDTNITQESDQYSNAIGNTEDYYYSQMKEAWQKAQEYRDSISDPEVKNAVQTPEGAVNGKYTELLELYPNDKQQIENAYQWVIRGQ